jgi:hypothetical protein
MCIRGLYRLFQRPLLSQAHAPFALEQLTLHSWLSMPHPNAFSAAVCCVSAGCAGEL